MSHAPDSPFVDIHCHLIPGIDDGASSWDVSLEMARMAAAEGIETIVTTPHQLGAYEQNRGDMIREKVAELQQRLRRANVPLTVLPGADVRIEPEMIDRLRQGDVLSLADLRKHVLLELPHEVYFPLKPVLDGLRGIKMTGILSHPERNQGLLEQPRITESLVQSGCLMQVTAGSLLGKFGPQSQSMSEWMIRSGLVHFIATDAHGVNSRRPLMRRAFQRVAELCDQTTATDLCCRNPAAVASGRVVKAGRRKTVAPTRSRWFRRGKVA